MKLFLVAVSIAFAPALGLAERPATVQGSAPSNSLSRVLAVFAACDADRDGKISADESRSIPVAPAELAKEDLDGDGSWSRDEFTLYYRGRLVAAGQTLGADLDAEVARIQALKRVRVVEERRKQEGDPKDGRAQVEPVRVRFEKALGELEQSAATRKAKPEDFRRLRNLVILNGRSAPESNAKVLEALERIEKRAATGQYDRQDYETLRKLAQSPIQAVPAPAKSGASAGSAGPVQGPAEARRRASEPRPELRKPTAPKGVPPPASKPPKDPRRASKP